MEESEARENRPDGYFRRKVGGALLPLFRQGVTPEKIAQCLVLGAVISVFPVLGTTTFLCAVVAVRLKLNLPAIQAVNWLFGGVQLALIWPFLRLGEWVFRVEPLPLSPAELAARLKEHPWEFIQSFQAAVLCAVTGWLLAAVPLAWLTYRIMMGVLVVRDRGKKLPVEA
ncbi:MAG TPA: DUF2062 domain-containing protein [Kiritimatiellia bacterium]|nr:DUF2062 domain-containing protein [Kiritimatiellia bacterium]HRZ12060.1 DUF2062 domain-containing protein [Kiritimatiellia bacterium]HSA19609.1 DUF2062 domain-containing protein [Kiritimatiellia bacterium]